MDEPGIRNRAVVVVSSAHPSYSETFVTSEIAALLAAGTDVFAYSIEKPAARLSPATDYIARPKSRLAMVPWLLRAMVDSGGRDIPRLRRGKGWREVAHDGLIDAHGRRLRSAMRRLGRDVVLHAHFLGYTTEVALRAARQDYPVVVTVHASDAYLPYTQERAKFLKRIAGFRFASEAARRTLTTDNPNVMGPVIPCVAELPEPRAEVKTARRPLNIVTTARLVPTKGYSEMCAAVETAAEHGPVRWHVVGAGEGWNRLSAWSTTTNSEIEVILYGALPHHEALKVLDYADVFLLLPRSSSEEGLIKAGDGLPVALLEAAARGIPIVTTNTGGIPELITDGETGWLVDPQNPAAVANALWEASDASVARRRTDLARQLVERQFHPAVTARAVERWLEDAKMA